jgi:phosphatidylglycerol---prolipoprotein diacylglyceryl transferase
MRQTLFRIPLDGPWSLGPFEVPGFGFGVVLLFWTLFGAVWLYRHRREFSAPAALAAPAGTWLAVAIAVVALPWLVDRLVPSHVKANAAIEQADRALAVDPHSVQALVLRSQGRFVKRDYAGAVEDLKTAVKFDDDDSAALNRLAWIQATCPQASIRDAAAAVENAKKACQLTASRNPEYLSTLSAALAEQGDFEKSVEFQRMALRLVTQAHDAGLSDEVPRMRQQMQLAEQRRAYRDDTAGTSVPVFGFGAMLFLGFVAGAWTAGRRAARIGLQPEMIWDVGIWLFIAGVIGCRAFYCIQYGSHMFYNDVNGHAVLKSLPNLIFTAVNLPDGGLVYYGGIPAGLLAAIWICRKRKISLLALGDVIIPSLFLGMAFGRIGCFLNGCCYGDRCDLPWGVQFPMGSVPDMALVIRGFVGADQDLNFRLHPTQLYSSLDGLFLYMLTAAYFPFRPRNGSVIALGALTYPISRFAIESLRADELGQFNTALTISQWISILTFVSGIVFALWLSRRPKLAPPLRVTPASA